MCLSRTQASDSYNNLWLSAWYRRVAVKHQQAWADCVRTVCVRVASLRPVGMSVRVRMCVSVNPVCGSLAVRTSLSSFVWTAESSQFTTAPALSCVRYWGFCDTCKLDKAGPNLQYRRSDSPHWKQKIATAWPVWKIASSLFLWHWWQLVPSQLNLC